MEVNNNKLFKVQSTKNNTRIVRFKEFLNNVLPVFILNIETILRDIYCSIMERPTNTFA